MKNQKYLASFSVGTSKNCYLCIIIRSCDAADPTGVESDIDN